MPYNMSNINRPRLSLIWVISVFLIIALCIFWLVSRSYGHTDISKPDRVSINIQLVSPNKISTVFQQTIQKPQVAQELYQDIISLHHISPGEVSNCPTGPNTYYIFDIRFQQKSTTVAEAINEVTNCAFWSLKNITTGEVDQYSDGQGILWRKWHQELGTPLPYTNSH